MGKKGKTKKTPSQSEPNPSKSSEKKTKKPSSPKGNPSGIEAPVLEDVGNQMETSAATKVLEIKAGHNEQPSFIRILILFFLLVIIKFYVLIFITLI